MTGTNNRPTPRTDATAGSAVIVKAEFARQLERENAEQKTRIEALESAIKYTLEHSLLYRVAGWEMLQALMDIKNE